MQMLNRYFTPFALILILTAIYFSELDSLTSRLALGILTTSIVVNWWISANTYRFVGWARWMRVIQVWITYVWSVPLFYLLQPFWAPMWLLFVIAPATAALYLSRWHALAAAFVSAATMLGIYYLRGALEAQAGGMACTHAAFILFLTLFIQQLAETSLRLRDANRS